MPGRSERQRSASRAMVERATALIRLTQGRVAEDYLPRAAQKMRRTDAASSSSTTVRAARILSAPFR
jgi:hypothetical protein